MNQERFAPPKKIAIIHHMSITGTYNSATAVVNEKKPRIPLPIPFTCLEPIPHFLDQEIKHGDSVADSEVLMDALHHVTQVRLGVLLLHVSLQVVPQTLLVELTHHHRGGIFNLHVDEVQ